VKISINFLGPQLTRTKLVALIGPELHIAVYEHNCLWDVTSRTEVEFQRRFGRPNCLSFQDRWMYQDSNQKHALDLPRLKV
jgi:hypothetical protein